MHACIYLVRSSTALVSSMIYTSIFDANIFKGLYLRWWMMKVISSLQQKRPFGNLTAPATFNAAPPRTVRKGRGDSDVRSFNMHVYRCSRNWWRLIYFQWKKAKMVRIIDVKNLDSVPRSSWVKNYVSKKSGFIAKSPGLRTLNFQVTCENWHSLEAFQDEGLSDEAQVVWQPISIRDSTSC